ncbi:hypothetical protein PCK1_000964 [Pneumocystis canis]|nr:hypothetical protein PCK1_000964 [Pneumocystis canis]
MQVLINMCLFLATIFGKLIQRIFFGPLHASEIEHLYERTWYSITETCVAMTIFRNNFDTMSIVVFVILIFLKTLHWLCLDRLDFTQRLEHTLWRFHIRIVISIISLLILDIIMTHFSVYTVLHEKPSMMLMFAFEFAILTSTIIGAAVKYTFNLIDSYSEDNWENKGLYVLYLELFLELFKLIAYTTFFMLALTFYGLPLHIIRDVYMALKSFLSKCRDLIRYKRVTNNMNQRFVDATFDEITATEDNNIDAIKKREEQKRKISYYLETVTDCLYFPITDVIKYILSCIEKWDKNKLFSYIPVNTLNYHSKTDMPICLSMISGKIENREYANLLQFKTDIMYVFDNAIKHNNFDTIYYKTAIRFKRQCEKLFSNAENYTSFLKIENERMVSDWSIFEPKGLSIKEYVQIWPGDNIRAMSPLSEITEEEFKILEQRVNMAFI